MEGPFGLLILTALVIGAVVVFFNAMVKIVPQKTAFLVERLGKYHRTMEAGFHLLIPFIDRIAYRHTLKEQARDVEPQICITKDNVSVEVDGLLYLQVIDPKNASYGIDNYLFAATQLAQTTMRSVIGRLELDRTFEEREQINGAIVMALDHAATNWGVKVTRYEVRNIKPPQNIRDAMEKQMRAEREKRAVIMESEGKKQAAINQAEGEKSAVIANSEGQKQKMINEAAGRAAEIEQIAKATANGIREIALAINEKGGANAVNLRIAEQYIQQFGQLAKSSTTMILPSNLTDVAGLVGGAATVLQQIQKKNQGE